MQGAFPLGSPAYSRDHRLKVTEEKCLPFPCASFFCFFRTYLRQVSYLPFSPLCISITSCLCHQLAPVFFFLIIKDCANMSPLRFTLLFIPGKVRWERKDSPDVSLLNWLELNIPMRPSSGCFCGVFDNIS